MARPTPWSIMVAPWRAKVLRPLVLGLLSSLVPVVPAPAANIVVDTRSLTISGNDAVQVLRVGNNQPLGDRVNVTLEGVTIARGRAPKNGGGIQNFGRLTIRNTSFDRNMAPEDGGAISNEGRGARLHVFNSTFSKTAASKQVGSRKRVAPSSTSTGRRPSSTARSSAITPPTRAGLSIIPSRRPR